MARRQLPHRRRAAPRDSRRPAPGLLPRAPQAGRGSSRRLPEGPRSRLGLHRPHGQPVRPGEPAAHGAWLPGGGAADDRRAVGDRDQHPHPPGREPPPSRGADRAQPGGAGEGGRARRQPARPRQGQPGGRGGFAATALAGGASNGGPGPALPAPARPGPGGHPRPPRAGGAPRGPGHHRRGDGPPRAPAPGDDERDGPQRDHEHAPHLVVRLGRVRRERQPGRRRPARAKSVRGDGLRDSRSLPARRGGAGAGLRPDRDRGCPDGRRDGGRRHDGRRRRTCPGGPTPGARLLPHLGRPPRVRTRPPRSGALGDQAAARVRSGRSPWLPRDVRGGDGAHPRRAAPPVLGRWRSGCRHLLDRDPRARPGLRPRHRPRQPRGHERAGPQSAAPARPGRRPAHRAANTRRRADAPHQRGGRRDPGRWPGGPLPGEPRGRPAVRAALGLARRPDRARPRRRRAPLGGGGGHRPAQRAPRRGSRGRRPVPALPPEAHVERGRGLLDGLGAQARQAPRAEHAAARFHDDRHPHDGAGRVDPAAGRALRGHARRRYPAAPGRGGAPRGDDRPSAQPAVVRREGRPGDPGLRRAPAADHLDAPGGARRVVLSADLLRAGRDRPVRVCRLRRLPGPLRGGELHRQGDLRPGRLQRGDGGPRTRERAPQPRPVRGGLRPGRAGDRRRALRRVPVQLPGLGGPRAPLGTGRLAAPALDPRPGPRRHGPAAEHSPRHRPLEDGRQPSPDDVRPAHAGHARRRLDTSLGVGRRLDRVRAGVGDRPRGIARPGGTAAATAGHLQAQPPAGPGRGRRPRRGPRGPRPHVPRAPGLADGRRDPADPGAGVCHPAEPPRMDDCRAGQGQRRPRPRWVLPADGGRRRDRGRHRGRSSSPSSRARPGSPRRSSSCGWSRPSSPAGSACHPRIGLRSSSRRPRSGRSA